MSCNSRNNLEEEYMIWRTATIVSVIIVRDSQIIEGIIDPSTTISKFFFSEVELVPPLEEFLELGALAT